MGVVKAITGRGITTSVAMESADLGAARWDPNRNAIALLFGDNFEFWRMQGEWRSPSIAMYNQNFDLLGVPAVVNGQQVVQQGRVKQLWPYEHNNPNFSTVLPCDFIKVGEWWYVYVMVTKGLGNELWTGWRRSKDLVDWELVQTLETNKLHPGQVMLTFDRVGDYIYIFGTGGLRRNRPIWAWRCAVNDFPLGRWEVLNGGNPILNGSYGELCFRQVQGHSVLSYFDAGGYRQAARTLPDPNHNWSTANVVEYAHGNSLPQLYGGYLSPTSRLNETNGMKFLVSQWNTATNDPYHVLLVEDTLHAQGALVEAPPEPEPEIEEPVEEPPVTEEPTETPTEPEVDEDSEAFVDMLVKELSKSGSVAILGADGKKRTLREALEAIHWKEITPLGLADRPRSPKVKDDQLGQVLSARAEGLITLALVDQLASRAGINTSEVYKQVLRSFQ